MNYKKIIGQNIRKKRKELGITIEQLAEMVGISENFMGNIERGDGDASLPTFIDITKALKCSSDLLLQGIFQNSISINNKSSYFLHQMADTMQSMPEEDQKSIYEIIEIYKASIDKYKK